MLGVHLISSEINKTTTKLSMKSPSCSSLSTLLKRIAVCSFCVFVCVVIIPSQNENKQTTLANLANAEARSTVVLMCGLKSPNACINLYFRTMVYFLLFVKNEKLYQRMKIKLIVGQPNG